MQETSYTLGQIAQFLSAEVKGDADIIVHGIAPLQQAKSGQLSFLDNPKYRKFLPETQASAVILTEDLSVKSPCATIVVENPYVAYAKVATLFEHLQKPPTGIDASAHIGKNCRIAASVSIGARVVIGDNVEIGEGTIIHAGCIVSSNVSLGDNNLLWPHATLCHGVKIGNHTIIHSGAVIGSDGFGFAFHEGSWLKIPQIGSVIIGDHVDIGANTTIDRGALGDTIIEQGVKLDNQVQVGHNVHIGAHTVVAGCTAIAGSTKIGKYCRIAGLVGIAGHLTIADQVVITGMTGVSSSIRDAGIYSSGIPAGPYAQWRKNSIRFQQLDTLARRISQLEQQLSHLQKDK